MGNMQKYSIDFKLQVVGKYEQGKCGYKRLAREFNLSRDTVREWCLNPKLHDATEVAKKQKINNDEEDLDYYIAAAAYWEEYAKLCERDLARQGKKKRQVEALKISSEKNPKIKIRKACKAAGISKSSFYYNKNSTSQKEKDKEVVDLLKKLPRMILQRRGNKAKSKELRRRFGKTVNHKRIGRICRENQLLARNRRRKFPRDYYKQQKENKKNLPRNILHRDFSSPEPLKKLCTDVSYFKTTEGWLYLSPVLDLHGSKIVCHAISNHNDDALADATLDNLFGLGALENCLLHSDQGVLYTAKNYRNRLKEKGLVQSMSRRGNCWDNACMEHFFGTLKVESGYDDLLKTGELLSFEDTKSLIDNFIKYYNNERIQQKLGWKTPSEVTA